MKSAWNPHIDTHAFNFIDSFEAEISPSTTEM